MAINVADFFIPQGDIRLRFNPLASFSRIHDYEKIFALSKRDFAEFYLKLMEEYRDKDGWWAEGTDPINCSKCNEEISGPRDLRRLYGRALHPTCFAEEMDLTKERGASKKYWKRVLELDLSLLDE